MPWSFDTFSNTLRLLLELWDFLHVPSSPCIEYYCLGLPWPSPPPEHFVENMQAPFLDQNKAADQYRAMQQVVKILEISTRLKMCQNFKAWVRGIVAHLPKHKIHNIKYNLVGYHHLKGLWDWSTYNRFRSMITMSTNYETPCSMKQGGRSVLISSHCFPDDCMAAHLWHANT